jgi:predicted RecB family nuclease
MTINPTILNINASMLRHLTTCQRRVWLDWYGDGQDKDLITPNIAFRLDVGIRHEAQVHRAVAPEARQIAVRNWSDGVKVTQTLMQRGVRSISGAYLEADVMLAEKNCILRVRGRIDRLYRVSTRVPDPYQYRPVEIKSYGKVSTADQLQLDCYIWLLRQMPGIHVFEGELWLGQSKLGEPRQRLVHEYDEARLFDALREIASLLLNHTAEPAVFLTHHCKRCQWYTACSTHAQRVYDVSLIPGLRKETHEDLLSAGIVSLNQIVELPAENLRQFRGIKSTAPEFHAQARAWVENRPIYCGALPGRVQLKGWMFDLETYRSSDATEQIWSMGWGRDGRYSMVVIAPLQERTTMISDGLHITLVPDADSAWQLFLQVTSNDDLPIFHWSPYDATILGKTASEDVKKALNSRFCDLHSVFKKTVKLPVDGTSLKGVARQLGFRWSGYDDYLMAYLDYKRWLDDGGEQKFASFSAYLSDDLIPLETAWNWMIRNVPLEHVSTR